MATLNTLAVALSTLHHAPWVPDDDDLEWVPCCAAAAYHGAEFCTCWEPEYDQPQQPAMAGRAPLATALCADCAYRPGSPERSDESSAEHLAELPLTGHPFYCHQGMRRVVQWRHQDGRTVPADPKDYQPTFNAGDVPVRASGAPADICAGWSVRRIKELRTR